LTIAEKDLKNSTAAISVTSSVSEIPQPSHSLVKFAEEEQVTHREGQV